MNIAFKIMMFTIFLNIGSGIVSTYYTPVIGFGQTEGYQDLDNLNSQASIFESSGDGLEDVQAGESSGWFDDFIGTQAVGLIIKVLDLLGTFLYGIGDMLEPILVPIGLDWVITMLNTVITILYGLTILNLIAGKSINGEGQKMSGYDLLINGSIFQAGIYSYELAMGVWFFALMFILVRLVLYILTNNAVLSFTVGGIMLIGFGTYLGSTLTYFAMTLAIEIAIILYSVGFKK